MDMEDAHTLLTPISQQEHSCLRVVADWKSPLEVAVALYPKGPTIPQRKKVAQALRRLHEIGLLKYGPSQNTYRQTDTGATRAAG
jgi:hypothetical protein